VSDDPPIENPAQFARAADLLVASIRALDQQTNSIFASSPQSAKLPDDIQLSIATAKNAIPTWRSAQMLRFINRLDSSAKAAKAESHDRFQRSSPARP